MELVDQANLPNYERNNMYDRIIRKATSLSVQNSISMRSQNEISREFSNHQWGTTQSPIDQIQVKGPVEHYRELSEMKKYFISNYWRDDEDGGGYFRTPTFQCEVINGGKFPKLKGQVSPFLINIENLQHVPGEVLIILMIGHQSPTTIETISKLQEVLLKNSANWEGKVRAVVVNRATQFPSGLKDQRGNKVCWKLVQHLELQDGEEGDSLMQLLGLDIYQMLLLVLNQDGVIKYNNQDQSKFGDIYKLITPLLKGVHPNEEVNDESGKSFEVQATENFESKLRKYKQLIANAQKNEPDLKLSKVTLKTAIKRNFNNGKLYQNISPINIDYTCTKEKMGDHEKWVSSFTKDLKTQQYNIDDFILAQEIMRPKFLKKIQNILKQNGIHGLPHFQSQYSLDMRNGSLGKMGVVPKFPKIKYKKDCSFSQGNKISQMISDFRSKNKRYPYSFESNYPWQRVNSEFFGVEGLILQKDGSTKNIEKIKGVALIIYHSNAPVQQGHLQPFAQLMKKCPGKLQLHIIAPRLTEQSNQQQGIFLYTDKINEDLTVLGFNNKQKSLENHDENVVIVNEQGIITKIGKLEKMLQMDIAEYLMPKKVIGQSLRQILNQLADSPIGQRVTEFIQRCGYQAIIRILFSKDASDQTTIKNAKLEIHIRESDRKQVQPLIELLRPKGVEIEATYYKTLDLPQGKECADCGDTLSYPYYYFPWSKVHRCMDCTQAADQHSEMIKKFSVTENAVLLSAPNTNVDLRRLGTNRQGKTQDDWRRSCFEFTCDSCGNQHNSIRYTCLGCKREPNPGDYIDFCQKCAKKLTGSHEQKQQVLVRCPNHSEHHPLLRMLYSSGNYGAL